MIYNFVSMNQILKWLKRIKVWKNNKKRKPKKKNEVIYSDLFVQPLQRALPNLVVYVVWCCVDHIFLGDTGRNRIKFDDPRTCKSFLLGCCPHDILSSTVSINFIIFFLCLINARPRREILLWSAICFSLGYVVIIVSFCLDLIIVSAVTSRMQDVCQSSRSKGVTGII